MRFDSDPRVCATFVGPFCWPLVWWVLKGVSTSGQMKVFFLKPIPQFPQR